MPACASQQTVIYFAFIMKLYYQVGHKKVFTIIYSKFVCLENRSISDVSYKNVLYYLNTFVLVVTKHNAVVHNSFLLLTIPSEFIPPFHFRTLSILSWILKVCVELHKKITLKIIEFCYFK